MVMVDGKKKLSTTSLHEAEVVMAKWKRDTNYFVEIIVK
jgi:hypothetical protein